MESREMIAVPQMKLITKTNSVQLRQYARLFAHRSGPSRALDQEEEKKEED